MTKNQLSRSLKEKVRARAQECCEYCWSQEKFATQSFSIEHIIPISKSGKTVLNNLALACQGCNNHKYSKVIGQDPITGQVVNLYHPRIDNWEDHFCWNPNYVLIIGLTSIGRATIETLNLNRKGLVNLRQILYPMGEHPPRLNQP